VRTSFAREGFGLELHAPWDSYTLLYLDAWPPRAWRVYCVAHQGSTPTSGTNHRTRQSFERAGVPVPEQPGKCQLRHIVGARALRCRASQKSPSEPKSRTTASPQSLSGNTAD